MSASSTARHFWGRQPQLERLQALETEPVALIYGLPGIGKSELAYAAQRLLRFQPTLRLLNVSAPESPLSLSSVVVTAVGAKDWPDVIAKLIAERFFLVIDDAHRAVPEVVALVDALMRHGNPSSRLIVTSRVMLPIATDPLSITLGPLEHAAAIALANQLAQRSGNQIEDVELLVAECSGVPALIRRRVSGKRNSPGLNNPTHQVIQSLPPASQSSLVTFAAVAACSQSASAVLNLCDDQAYEQLTQNFLIAPRPNRFEISEHVRQLVLALADPAVVRARQLDAANWLWEEFERTSQPRLAIESICLSLTANHQEQGFERLAAAGGAIAKASLDHLLLPVLLRESNTRDCRAIVAIIRIHLRLSHINAAAQLAATVPASCDSAGLHIARATIAERQCRLQIATREYHAAIGLTSNEQTRSVLQMRLAFVRALAGDIDDCRRLIASTNINQHAMSDSEFARLAWLRAGVAALQVSWREALEIIHDGRRAAQRCGASDVDYLLVLLELLATTELGDVEGSRNLARTIATNSPSHYLHMRMATFYLGVSLLAQGRVQEAAVALERAYQDYDTQDDELLALVAGHFWGRALTLHDETSLRAVEVLSKMVNRAAKAEVGALLGIGRLSLARALLDVGRVAEGDEIARVLIEDPNSMIAGEAHSLLGFACAFRGDLDEARKFIASGLRIIGDLEPVRTNLVLDHAYIEVLGGDPEIARNAALAIVEDEHRRRRPDALGRALIILAIADIAAGLIDTAITYLAEVDAIADATGIARLRVRASMLRNALASHGASILDRVPLAHKRGYVGVLRVLGLRPETVVVSGRAGREYTDAQGLVELARRHDITVDLASGAVHHRSGSFIEGRGVAASILATLAESRTSVTAERLYQVVWGGHDYHSLRHRNTLYIALNRTRKLLADLGETREVIRRDGDGWSIATDIDLVVARRDPRVSTALG